ncbi:MAG: glycosyltransferase family 2 protein [Gemmobacter sp.]
MPATLPTWGLCTTLKAPADQVLAFVAHHLALGAARLWLHFDDPDDPAFDRVAAIPGVTAIRCDDDYWQALLGRRPARHQLRQSRNVERVHARGELAWLGHIDVDEFLWPARPVAEVLAATDPASPVLRMAPCEALHDPRLPDDIFTARQFRRPLRGPDKAALRQVALGDYADLLPNGVLSHYVGKCFFRSGVPGLQPRIHSAEIDGKKLQGGPFSPEIALLHFHAQDPAAWRERLAFRRSLGAYSFNMPLMLWLCAASEAEIDAFYATVQTARPAALAALLAAGALVEADLNLRDRIRALEARR